MQNTLTNTFTARTLATFTLLVLTACGQTKTDWTQLTSFRIYDYQTFPQGKDIHSFSDNDIQEMNFIEADLAEAKKILSKAEPSGNKTYLWKGHHFAMATFANGQKRRLKISTYGGFLMDLATKEYYEFKDEARKDWDQFWTEHYTSLHKQTETRCDKCDIEKLKIVNDHLDGLTFKIVHNFLCTFDTSCKNHVEFSEWSNELLFKVLEKSSSLFLEAIATGQVNNEVILNEMESPVRDINLQSIYDKIKAASGDADIKTKYLNAVIIASKKDGQQIRR